MKKIQIFLALFLCLRCFQAGAQVSQANVTYGAGFPYVGWDETTTAHDLDIVNQYSRPIKFYTSSTFSSGLFSNKRMTIFSTGEVGIGNFTGPVSLLDVDGDINIKTPGGGLTYAYKIDGTTVLTERYVSGSFLLAF